MLETVDFSQDDLSKQEYKAIHDELIEKLVVLQQQARSRGAGLVVVFEGWNGAGKGSRISDLMFNLDARATSVYVTPDLNVDSAREFAGAKHGVTGYFPFMQEFWRALGERSAITFYDRGWYTAASQQVLYNVFGGLALPDSLSKKKAKKAKKDLASKKAALLGVSSKSIESRRDSMAQRCLASIYDFEQQLTDDGYEVVKFFVHMTEKGQRKRLEKFHDNPETRWRVSEAKLSRIGNYKEAYRVYDMILEGSDFEFAPWVLLNGENKRSANVRIAEVLIAALERALARKDAKDAAKDAAKVAAEDVAQDAAQDTVKVATQDATEDTTQDAAQDAAKDAAQGGANDVEAQTNETLVAEASAEAVAHIAQPLSRFPLVDNPPSLDEVDHTLTLDEATYREELKSLQKRLFALENKMFQERIPLMLMYEGWDAAGKGGNIKRVAQALDARAYTIFPSPAPTKPELAHPHLWRYWTRLPKAGHVGIYDRSWYGRVLVERIEGFATPEEWGRAYDELNAFERDLTDWGAILLKFWVEVSPDEQLRRFQDRQNDPNKRWKITDDDWRNREKYPQYKEAIQDMFARTSTTYAPWIILESDDKRYARIKALRSIVEALEAAGL